MGSKFLSLYCRHTICWDWRCCKENSMGTPWRSLRRCASLEFLILQYFFRQHFEVFALRTEYSSLPQIYTSWWTILLTEGLKMKCGKFLWHVHFFAQIKILYSIWVVFWLSWVYPVRPNGYISKWCITAICKKSQNMRMSTGIGPWKRRNTR